MTEADQPNTGKPAPPWMVSLHGGHSGDYCDHAEGSLESLLAAAVARGLRVYGVTEHAPRDGDAYLYAEERAMGWTVATLFDTFARYAERLRALQVQFAGRLDVLRGFETEVVPEGRYAEVMERLREEHAFEYIVGSVHHVAGYIIDYRPEHFAAAAAACGGIEGLAVRYYETVGEMVARLHPEVVAHFDLIRRNAPDDDAVATPRVREAAFAALAAVARAGSILDINTGGFRKGLGRPYPAPWILEEAKRLGISVCFGDDSHRAGEVGAGISDARDYLLALGIDNITALEHAPDGALVRRILPLA